MLSPVPLTLENPNIRAPSTDLIEPLCDPCRTARVQNVTVVDTFSEWSTTIRKAKLAELSARSTNPRELYTPKAHACSIHRGRLPADPNSLCVADACAKIEHWAERNDPLLPLLHPRPACQHAETGQRTTDERRLVDVHERAAAGGVASASSWSLSPAWARGLGDPTAQPGRASKHTRAPSTEGVSLPTPTPSASPLLALRSGAGPSATTPSSPSFTHDLPASVASPRRLLRPRQCTLAPVAHADAETGRRTTDERRRDDVHERVAAGGVASASRSLSPAWAGGLGVSYRKTRASRACVEALTTLPPKAYRLALALNFSSVVGIA
ncbi:hypothetical protein BJY52DRAFT_1191762 [Lactarius psammicola]|nr:hypothetical protein BJY52DRAFT_1191762 [Lactarius psammicola]